jgi:hypothetical protein
VVRAPNPPQRYAHVDGAMEILEYLLHGLKVSARGGCLGGAKDAQGRGDIGACADGRVLEAAHEGRIDVLCHPDKGVGDHVREVAGVHREGRWFRVGHAIENVTQVLDPATWCVPSGRG